MARPRIGGRTGWQTRRGRLRPGAALVSRLRGLRIAVSSAAKGFYKTLSPVQVPPAMAERLFLDQASDLAYIMTAISTVGLCTVALLILDFNPLRLRLAEMLAFASVIASYFALLWRCFGWIGIAKPAPQQANAFITATGRLAGFLGVFWALTLVTLMLRATAEQRDLLYGTAVACLATPVMVAPISCAIGFWLPVFIGALLSLVIREVDPFALTLLFGLALLTGFSIVYLNRRLTERAINTFKMQDHGATINLLLRDFEENAADWLWETDAALQLHASPRLAEVTRRPQYALAGPFPAALLGEPEGVGADGNAQLEKLNGFIADRSPFRDLVVPVLVRGEPRFWSLTGKPILDKDGKFAGYHGVGSDITAQRRSQDQIAFLARHDSLTKLANRVLFNEVLHQAAENCDAQGFALLCLDLDDFKLVNDTLGHATGDGILVAVAERIHRCIRDVDLAARLGGDEFAIILMATDPGEIAQVAKRMIEYVGQPYHFDGRIVQTGVSIGITLAPKDQRTPGGLMKNADLALYRAKAAGRAVWRFYDLEMDERLQDRRALQSDLRQALIRGEFHLNYQPIVDLPSQRIVGAEALLRWNHPERGLLSPADFIPMAEEVALIGQIGRWVLTQACRTAILWPASTHVAVNLSPLQFRDAGLVAMIDDLLAQTGLAPERLELEITETTMLETNPQTVDTLWQLHRRGILIALDDFGTGYSSLSYLRRLPFNKIKIDRSFIRDLGYEKDDSSIIIAIIGLAKNLGMSVTAEGVETSGQAALLKSYGCPQAQGFLFYRPLSAADITRVMMEDDDTLAGRPDYGFSQDAAQ